MKTDIKSLSKTKNELLIELNWEDVAKDYEKYVKKFARKIELPGFRKGKVPVSRVEKLYSDKIEYEFINEKFYTYYYDAIQKTESKPVSEPSISDLKFNKGENIIIKVEFDTIPEWDIPEISKKIKVEKPVFLVEDEDIQENIEYLRKQYAEVKAVDGGAEMGYHLKAVIKELDESGNVIEGRTIPEGQIILGESIFQDKVADALVGIKVGEEREILIEKFQDTDVDRKYLITPTLIEEHVLPEVNDEFAQTVDADLENLDALKAKITKDITNQWETEANNRHRRNIMDALSAAIPELELPDSLIDSYLDEMHADNEARQGGEKIDKEEFKIKYKDEAAKGLKWQLIRDKIKTAQKIEATDKDVEAKIDSIVENLQDDATKDMYRKYYEDEKNRSDLKYQALEDKVFNYLIKNLGVKTKKIKRADRTKGE